MCLQCCLLSKNLATLGSGNIEIADKENSDDLTRLNRDTTKLTKDLVNTSISSNVDASMDLRVLTKSGQKDIKDEFNTATAITKALNAIIETGEFNFNSEVKENVAQYEAGKLLGKELAQKLIDDSVTIEEKEALGNKFIELFASKAGLDLDGISLRIIDDKFAKGKDDEKFLGHFNSGSIILNLAHIKNVDQFVSTLGHELKHAIDYKAGKFIPGDSKQDRYAKLKEDSFSYYLNKALNLQDSGINAKDAAINYTKNQSSLNTLLLNSYMFNGLDKSKGGNKEYKFGIYNHIDDLKINDFKPLAPIPPLTLVDPETKGVAVGGARIKSVEKTRGNKIKINDYKSKLSKSQVANIQRAIKKIPANSKENIEIYKENNGNIIFKAVSPGKVPGSKAEYIKVINKDGDTIAYNKITYDPKGNIVHDKDKFNTK